MMIVLLRDSRINTMSPFAVPETRIEHVADRAVGYVKAIGVRACLEVIGRKVGMTSKIRSRTSGCYVVILSALERAGSHVSRASWYHIKRPM